MRIKNFSGSMPKIDPPRPETAKRYRKFSAYLKDKFGERVHKIGIDAGFSCPNRDGKISSDGCIYCNNTAFSFNSRSKNMPTVEAQIREGIKAAGKKFKAEKFIVYFQAYTNTYAAASVLKERYDAVRKFDNIVGIAIATRPDCVNKEVLEVIAGYKKEYDVWLEYGLQSIHDKTLAFINRGHKYGDFLEAVELTRGYGIKVCVHIILGLPGETKEMMLDTAKEMARLKIGGIKLHPLHVVRGTVLEKIFRKGEYRPPDIEEYADIVADFLTHLWPETVIERIGAYCPKELLAAPAWISRRNIAEERLEKILVDKNYWQGKFFKEDI